MTKKLMAQCEYCKDWFPSKKISGVNETLMTKMLSSNIFNSKETCTICSKETQVSNSNLKIF